jgi:hypothetical protein
MRLTATANFVANVRYGPFDPESAWNGDYLHTITYQLRAIVADDGNDVSVVKGSAVVAGETLIVDERTTVDWKVPVAQRRPIPLCRGWEGEKSAQRRGTSAEGNDAGHGRFKPVPLAGVELVWGRRLSVAPEGAFPTKWGCGDADLAHMYGHLQVGPDFSIAAPALFQRYSNTKNFSFTCRDDWWHEFKPNPRHGHEFVGRVIAYVTFVAFPASQLGAMQKRLRAMVGTDIGRPILAGVPATSGGQHPSCG